MTADNKGVFTFDLQGSCSKSSKSCRSLSRRTKCEPPSWRIVNMLNTQRREHRYSKVKVKRGGGGKKKTNPLPARPMRLDASLQRQPKCY